MCAQECLQMQNLRPDLIHTIRQIGDIGRADQRVQVEPVDNLTARHKMNRCVDVGTALGSNLEAHYIGNITMGDADRGANDKGRIPFSNRKIQAKGQRNVMFFQPHFLSVDFLNS